MLATQLEQAASLMATGCYREAMSMLDQVLEMLRVHFFAQEVEQTSADKLSGFGTFTSPIIEASLGPVCVATSAIEIATSEYRVFERAILIQSGDDCVLASEENVAVATAAALYNKGLILHVLGHGDPTRLAAEAYITKARLLYEKAHCLINMCSPSADNNFWLKCALHNNLGQICYHVNDRPAEQIFLMGLDQLLTHRLDQHTVEGDEADLLFNVILLFGVHRPSPAA